MNVRAASRDCNPTPPLYFLTVAANPILQVTHGLYGGAHDTPLHRRCDEETAADCTFGRWRRLVYRQSPARDGAAARRPGRLALHDRSGLPVACALRSPRTVGRSHQRVWLEACKRSRTYITRQLARSGKLGTAHATRLSAAQHKR